jgi:hypothetical protein
MTVRVQDLVHPQYEKGLVEWQLYRDVSVGGSYFIQKYLKPYSAREDPAAFLMRQILTYNPSFAKSAVNEIKNAIFQRLIDISRSGGPESYQRAVRGEDQGVDLLGSTMNAFLGRKVLNELLVMGRVGVFVDMPQLSGITLSDTIGMRPYLYTYVAEEVRSWRFDEYSSQSEFSSILLRDYVFEYDENLGLPVGERVRYRHLWISDEDGKVHCRFYGDTGNPIAANQSFQNPPPSGLNDEEDIILDLDRIPFVLLEISESLLTDVARYQIALLNIESSDLAYILNNNFPLYTEQYEPRAASQFVKNTVPEVDKNREPGNYPGIDGPPRLKGEQAATEIKSGPSRGRRYPVGTERPGFIAPPTDPLTASMKKQQQLKDEIRQLVHLAVANLQPKDASAESKDLDNQGLESGLSYIGLELEHAERRIADYWSMYDKSRPATVQYPEKYSLRSEGDRRDEAKELGALLETVQSPTYRKEICKRLVTVLLSNKIANSTLDTIKKEIDASVGISTAVDVIMKHIEVGILDLELAAKMCGYPKGTVDKAAKEHVARLEAIAQSQSAKSNTQVPGLKDAAARGVGDLDSNPVAGGAAEKKVSRDTTSDGTVTDKTRGNAK